MSELENDQEKVLLGTVELADGKRLRSLLEERGIHIELVSQAEHCNSRNCKITVEVHADPKDVAAISELLASERQRLLDGLGAQPELHAETFDTEKETAICPACGTSFSTKNKECPDCGLVFIAE